MQKVKMEKVLILDTSRAPAWLRPIKAKRLAFFINQNVIILYKSVFHGGTMYSFVRYYLLSQLLSSQQRKSDKSIKPLRNEKRKAFVNQTFGSIQIIQFTKVWKPSLIIQTVQLNWNFKNGEPRAQLLQFKKIFISISLYKGYYSSQ